MRPNRYAQVLWAGRELLAHPGATLLIALSLGLLTTMLATALLLSQALTATTSRLLAQGPDLVVRRVTPDGGRPVSVQATATALAIPGIIDAHARIWGTVRAPQGAVTVVAADEKTFHRLQAPGPIRAPGPGEALVGNGVIVPPSDSGLVLQGVNKITVRVTQHFPLESDLVTHDLVMLHPDDARRLLGLAPGDACDLALTVFHPDEAEALLPELARAFPWPVHIATRQDTRKHYATAFGRHGGLAALLYIPAAIALLFLVASVVRQQMGNRARVGLFKALGWTSRDIVALQVTKALLVGLPAIAGGVMIAYGLVYAPSQQWVGTLLLGWQETAPLTHLDAGHASTIFLEVTGILLIPYLAAVLWSSLVQAASDPQDLLNRGT
jgi:FtsX-like permease family